MSARIVLSIADAIVQEVELTKPVTVVGRRPDCDIVIPHPAVSGRHAVLRLEERGVYLEDLASTNGVRVNGLPCSRQVIQHLDLIEIGEHKMHFFDDALLVSRVSNLERTVHSDFEHTVIGGQLAPAHGAASGGFAETVGSRTQPLPAYNPALGPATVRVVDSTQLAVLALRVVSGPDEGTRIPLREHHTMIGTAGEESALVVRRGRNYFLARLGHVPRLNGQPVAPGTHPIAAGDLIEVGARRYEVIQHLESQ